jgi:hypothetical protein
MGGGMVGGWDGRHTARTRAAYAGGERMMSRDERRVPIYENATTRSRESPRQSSRRRPPRALTVLFLQLHAHAVELRLARRQALHCLARLDLHSSRARVGAMGTRREHGADQTTEMGTRRARSQRGATVRMTHARTRTTFVASIFATTGSFLAYCVISRLSLSSSRWTSAGGPADRRRRRSGDGVVRGRPRRGGGSGRVVGPRARPPAHSAGCEVRPRARARRVRSATVTQRLKRIRAATVSRARAARVRWWWWLRRSAAHL